MSFGYGYGSIMGGYGMGVRDGGRDGLPRIASMSEHMASEFSQWQWQEERQGLLSRAPGPFDRSAPGRARGSHRKGEESDRNRKGGGCSGLTRLCGASSALALVRVPGSPIEAAAVR